MIRRTSTPYVNDTTRGKSFNFSEWDDLTAYNNNAIVQDFVSYAGAMYVCLNSVQAGDVDPRTDTADGSIVGNYWMQIVNGVEGPKGDDGKIYVPTVSSAGTLSWKVNSGTTPKSVNIKGPQGDPGLGLEFKWSGTKLLVRQEGSADWTASPDLASTIVYTPVLKNGNLVFEPTNTSDYQPINFGKIKGKDGVNGKNGADGKPGKDGKDGLSAYELAKKHGFTGSEAAWLRNLETNVKGAAPKNLLLRVDSDPALFPDENYCGTHIQWKYDSDDYTEWNNLIQINQLMNLALAGLNLNYVDTVDHDGKKCYHLALDYNEIDYIDTKNNVQYGPKIRTLSDVYIPIYGNGSAVDPDKPASVDTKSIVLDRQATCEKYFYISDPNNKGWVMKNNISWLDATPGGADTAFDLQEGEDSALTPCETVTIDKEVSGTGSTLVMLCADENTGSSRTGTITLTASGEITTINIKQN